MSEQILNIHITPFDKNDRGPLKNNKLDHTQLYSWSYWENVIQSSKVVYDLDYEEEHYQYYDWDFFYEYVYADILETYETLYKDKWSDNKKPTFETDPLFAQKVFVDNKEADIVMIGDLHSSLHSLYDIIKDIRYMFVDDTLQLNNNSYIFFLGDIADRGPYCLELFLIIFLLKIKNPNSVYIINGNHEDFETYKMYSFKQEIDKQFGTEYGEHFSDFNKLLFLLPSVIYLIFNGKTYHLSHGAFDREYAGYENGIIKNSRLLKFLESDYKYDLIKDKNGFNSDFKWGDFYQDIKEFEIDTKWGRNRFGYGIVNKYSQAHNIECLITGHQDMTNVAFMLNKNIDGFVKCSQLQDCMPKYDLFVHKKQFSEYHRHLINMKPGTDFLALVTSSATIPRQLSYNTFLILDDKSYEERYERMKGACLDLAINKRF